MEQIRSDIQQLTKEIFDIDIVPELTIAPANTGADFASNIALKLAGMVGRSPREIAVQIKESLADYDIEVAGPGFLNITLPDSYFKTKLDDLTLALTKMPQESVLDKEQCQIGSERAKTAISGAQKSQKPIIVEFSDPNPFKVLHVGHLYTSIVGDAISRILTDSGENVVRANFGGDVGLHVGKTLWSVQKQGISPDDLTIELIAQHYVLGTNAYEEDEAAKAEIVALNKEIYEISRIGRENDLLDSTDKTKFTSAESLSGRCAELYGDDAYLAELYWRGRELSYQYFKDFYARIGVKFDRFYPESTVADRGMTEVKTHIGSTYKESNGAIVYKGEKKGLHTRVFINNEGVPTYETKDVGLIFSKNDDYSFARSIVITGNEQKDYMRVVLASIEEYSPELVDKTMHLTHGLVKLPGNEKMSSRKGNFIRAVDVLDVVRDELAKNSPEQTEVDERLVLAAIKYAFLKYKMGGDIIFEPSESVSMTGNSGIYLLYSAVRAKKILQKIEQKNELNKKVVQEKTEVDEPKSQAEQVHERILYKKCVQYGEVLKEAKKELAPYKICNFLYELAQEFSRFYENVPVANSDNEAERIRLVSSYLTIIRHGLMLLGIEIPEEM